MTVPAWMKPHCLYCFSRYCQGATKGVEHCPVQIAAAEKAHLARLQDSVERLETPKQPEGCGCGVCPECRDECPTNAEKRIRRFETGATRDSNVGKYEYARFFDPRVLEARAAYMDKHRHLPDGSLREPDDWKRGIPTRAYMDGLFRHVMDVWLLHDYGEATRPENGEKVELVEALCAVMFNAEGWLHTLLNEEESQ